jgi:predicted permease
MWHDLVYSVRVLSKNLRFAILAVATLGLGIGAATAVFAVFDAALVRALPVREPERLVVFEKIAADGDSDDSFPYPVFRALRDRGGAIVEPVAYWHTRASVDAGRQPERVAIELVSGNYFQVLGVQAARGRLLTPDDDGVVGASPVAVISYAYWQRALGGADSALGSTLRINGYPFTIVGISAPSFHGFTVGAPAALQVPMQMQGQVSPDWQVLERPYTSWHQILAGLKPGVSIDRARSALNGLFQQITRERLPGQGELPPSVRDEILAERLTVSPAARGLSTIRQQYMQPLWILLGVVALLLLIACANFANLLIARGLSRSKEIALREALGAGRGRLVRQLMIESLLLGLLGGVVALVPAISLARLLLSLLPDGTRPTELIVVLDSRVMLFSLAVSAITGLFFGALPGWMTSRVDLTSVLKGSSAQGGEGRATPRLRAGFVIVQLAFVLVLLAGTGVLLRTVYNLRHVELGFRQQQLLLFAVSPSDVGYTKKTAPALYERLLGEIAAAPGVQAATVSRVAVLSGNARRETIAVPGYAPRANERMNVDINIIGLRYFETLGIPLTAGRDFTRADSETAGRVAIVNESFVRRFLGADAPLGRDVYFGQIQPDVPGLRIVGVVRDTKYHGVRQETVPLIYVPLAQEPVDDMTVYAWTTLPPATVLSEIRRRVVAIEPNLPIFYVRTIAQQIDDAISQERLLATLSSTVGGVALVLAMVGLYSVISYNVSRRVREMGVRMALGADRASVLGLLMKQNARIILLGLIAGGLAAAVLLRLLRDRLYGVTPLDPLVTLAAVAIVAAVGIAAGLGPAMRATRRDPASVLRTE